MPPSKQIIYVDTNVIIEATRTGCWKAILDRYEIRTVETVRQEALREPVDKNGYVPIDADLLARKVAVEPVDLADILRASTVHEMILVLDPGERDLLAHLTARSTEAWLVSTADRAAVESACALGLGHRLRSLEEMASDCGMKPGLNDWYRAKWLKKLRTDLVMDSMF